MYKDYRDRLYTYEEIEAIISVVSEKIGKETDNPACERCMKWFRKRLPALVKNEAKLLFKKRQKDQ